MDAMNQSNQPFNPRRRRKTKWEIFKEAYFPVIIAGSALLLIVIFIIGSIVRSFNNDKNAKTDDAALQQQTSLNAQQELEANTLIAQAKKLTNEYRYEEAIAVIDSFSGDIHQFPALEEARLGVEKEKSQLIAWDDPAKVTHLSLQMLIADPSRAYQDSQYGEKFLRNFLTVEEFKIILDKLYAAGYVLVNIEDVYLSNSSGTGYQANTIYLPSGKKPCILTQTNVNYHTYLTNSDADKLPDAGGRGFASKLIFDEAGQLTCEYVNGTGQQLTGDYDMIPILNKFIAAHPDFSYQGAKAVIAVTGYDGLFGYRTNSEAEAFFGSAYYDNEVKSAKKIADALRNDGYELACYTFSNVAYGNYTAAQIAEETARWTSEVVPILGDVSIFAYAQNSDIAAEGTLYNTDKYSVLADAGFRIFLGFCNNGTPWSVSTDNYVRQGRILLCPSTVRYHPEWFHNALTASEILDPNRGTIPA